MSEKYDLVEKLRSLYFADEALLEQAADRIEELEAKLSKAVEALIWCSGSSDFNESGVAREGWLKLCAPILAELKGQHDE